jgi:hypothetical protein
MGYVFFFLYSHEYIRINISLSMSLGYLIWHDQFSLQLLKTKPNLVSPKNEGEVILKWKSLTF